MLRNPRWETKNVGFNEEAQISVEVTIPEPLAHKTRIVFELFYHYKKRNRVERLERNLREAMTRIAQGLDGLSQLRPWIREADFEP